MHLYHSTRNKEKILKENRLKVSTEFNYAKYLEWLLQQSYSMQEPYQFKGSYPGARRGVAPFMGHGIYCYNNVQDAGQHQSNAEVVEIEYSDDFTQLDLDDENEILKILSYIEEIRKAVDEKFDKEMTVSWNNLLHLLELCIFEDFKESAPAVGLILHILVIFKKIGVSDLLIKSFYDKIVSVSNKSSYQKKYVLIRNVKKIVEIS